MVYAILHMDIAQQDWHNAGWRDSVKIVYTKLFEGTV